MPNASDTSGTSDWDVIRFNCLIEAADVLPPSSTPPAQLQATSLRPLADPRVLRRRALDGELAFLAAHQPSAAPRGASKRTAPARHFVRPASPRICDGTERYRGPDLLHLAPPPGLSRTRYRRQRMRL
jgi:hypothetical protein